MATQASLDQIQNLYIAFYGRPAEPAGREYWADQLEAAGGDLSAIINAFAASAEYDDQYGSLTNEELVNALYQQILDRDAEQAGLDYYVGELEAGNITKGEVALAILNGATGDDATTMANRKAVADAFTAAVAAGDKEYGDDQIPAAKALLAGVGAETDPATVDVQGTVNGFPDAEEPVDPGTPGEVFSLTASTDALTGTENNDTFEGYLSQNAFAGGVSNTLSSADRIDGGAGVDTLDVELVNEFVGVTTGTNIDVQPRTSNVEVIEVEARDLNNQAGGTVTLDAKNMTDIDRIGSHFSDADLIIENLTTLTSSGDIRLTEDLTVVMQHTDNFNSDLDASDLTVLFDEDYLNTSTTTGGSTLLVRLVNAVTNVTNDNPIFGTDGFTIMVGETEVAVDLTDIAADDTLDYTTAYNQVVNAINTAVADAGFDTITASLQPLAPTVFSLPVTVDGTEYEPGDSAGSYFPILITNSGPEELGKGSFTQGQVNTDTDINSTMNPAPASETELPISINVELEKVGRDGEGGNLTIGGKDWQSSDDTDQDQNNGIEIFNISVVGDDSKPSNLGQIISTDGALRTVNIVTADTTLDSFAALTVRGDVPADNETGRTAATPFGGTLETLNANGFLGNLQIGRSDASRAVDIETFTATGGGDVTYWASIAEGSDLASNGNLAFSATTGAGNDTINADIDGGAQYTVTTGAGNDTVVADIVGTTDSGSTLSKLIVNSVSGSNTVTVSSSEDDLHAAEINLGSGADTVRGNNVNIEASTGAGNDTIYVENTGDKAVAEVAAGASALAADANNAGTYVVGDKTELLFGRSVRVTLDLPEDAGTLNTAAAFTDGLEATFEITASNGHLTTERDLYEAAANAINEDDVLNKLASATVDSNGNLIVTYLIDGVTDADSIVDIEVLGDWADLTATEQSSIVSELQAKYEDSDIDAADVENEYDEVNALNTALATTSEGSDSADSTDNTVNAGLGDDVIVLSSDATSVDTLEFDAGGFGNDTVVHFDQPTDLLDFSAWLNNVESTSGSSVSETRIDGTVATVGTIIENSVVVTDMSTINDNDALLATALNFDTMTDNQVLNELNAAGTEFLAGANDANLVGDELKVIIMIEDVANAVPADNNEGFYKVYEVVYNDNAGEFTTVQLVGSLDLGSSDAFGALADGNII